MSETYFKNFNTIQYGNSTSNTSVVDITKRIVELRNAQKNPYLFYPLDITNGARADQVAYYNYNDAYASWVLYLTNDIVDPYYEWYLTQDQFDQFIVTKYSSYANATQTIAFWRNNWVDQPAITTTAYAAEIAGNPQRIKYWTPNYNNSSVIQNYIRAQNDWIINTNKMIDVVTTMANSFIQGEVVQITTSGGVATGQVLLANNTDVMVQHIISATGDLSATGTIQGTWSNTNGSYTSITYTANTIPDNEAAYWSPVYNYDYENEKNQGNRTIRFLKPDYVPSFIKNTKDLLGQ
jgi:hypothetical protein